MLTKTKFAVDVSLIDRALETIPSDDFKFTINEPTGDFFYDPWKIKEEFRGLAWEHLYNSLPTALGETRIIRLEGGKQYLSHADIDDRFHLNLSGNCCYLIDLDKSLMHATEKNGIWYEMDAGIRHSAVNFSNRYRYQLVARKLLNRPKLKNPRRIKISHSVVDPDDARYYFDDVISPWLNRANKRSVINNFSYSDGTVSFDIENTELRDLIPLFNEYFVIELQ
jgi:hypothetical protein